MLILTQNRQAIINLSQAQGISMDIGADDSLPCTLVANFSNACSLLGIYENLDRAKDLLRDILEESCRFSSEYITEITYIMPEM